MKKLTKRIQAFTLAEMLVVLVISGIVISLALVVLNLVQKQISSITHYQEKQTALNLLENILWQDFNAHEVIANRHKLYCISEKDTVTYILNQDFTLRNGDTLKVPVFDIKTYLDGNIVNGNSIVDALELQVSQSQTDKILFVYKTKDAAYYMNHGF